MNEESEFRVLSEVIYSIRCGARASLYVCTREDCLCSWNAIWFQVFDVTTIRIFGCGVKRKSGFLFSRFASSGLFYKITRNVLSTLFSRSKTNAFPSANDEYYYEEIPRNPRNLRSNETRKREREAPIKRINSTRPRDTSSILPRATEARREKEREKKRERKWRFHGRRVIISS